MPHIIVEHDQAIAATVDSSSLLKELRLCLIEADLFSPSAIKARAISYDRYALEEGISGFVHIKIAILTGRDEVQRQRLSQSVHARAKQLLGECGALSVEIHEMDAASYTK